MPEYHTSTTKSKNRYISNALKILRNEAENIQTLSARCYQVRTPPSEEGVRVSPRGCSSPRCKKLRQPCEHLWATYGAFGALVIQDAWRARAQRGIKHAYLMLDIIADGIPKKYMPTVRRELAAAERRITGGAAL